MISIKTDTWCIDNIDAVVFDKDGTIIDSHLYWGRIIERRAKALLSAYSLPYEYFDALCLTMGYSVDQKRLQPGGPIALVDRDRVIDIVNEFLRVMKVDSDVEQISELFAIEHKLFTHELLDYIDFLPGVAKFLSQLNDSKIKMAIVTSDSVCNSELILKHLGIDQYFRVIIGKESTAASKITGVPVMKALEQMGVESQRTICIGDAPVDIIMAIKSECLAGIGVTSGQLPADELLKHTKYVISSMAELEICR